MKTISKKEINSIIKEFKILARGQSIKVQLPPIKLDPIDIHISWKSDIHCETSYDDRISSYKLIPHIDKITDQAMLKHRYKYNIKINKFIHKVETLEKRYSLPHNQLWEDYLWTLAL